MQSGIIVWLMLRCQKHQNVAGRLSAKLYSQLACQSVSPGDRIASWVNWDRQQQAAMLEGQEKRRAMCDAAIRQYEEIITKVTAFGRDS